MCQSPERAWQRRGKRGPLLPIRGNVNWRIGSAISFCDDARILKGAMGVYMRYILGLVLVMICLPTGGAADRTTYLTGIAGVPIHLFDLQAADVSQTFRRFLSEVPMTNDRPVPSMLVDDTVASLAYLKAVTPADEPSYFVATYIQKTPLVSRPDADRSRYRERYGEDVYPQQACPVFISRGDATVPRLLSAAVSLPPSFFSEVEGSAHNFDRLFALTEASHCGFIARELVQPTVLPSALTQQRLRSILEALGDYEATEVFRAGSRSIATDEADVLFAARLLAMFLLDRENPYTVIPGLLHEYERIGIAAAHRDLDRILQSVRLARRVVRTELGAFDLAGAAQPVAALQARVEAARAAGRLTAKDELAVKLIDHLGPALELMRGVAAEPLPWRLPAATPGGHNLPGRLVTLSGTGA